MSTLCGAVVTTARTSRNDEANPERTRGSGLAELHEGLSDANDLALAKCGAGGKASSAEDEDRRAVAKVPNLLPARERRSTRDTAWASIRHVQRDIDELELNARHENRGHRHKHQQLVRPNESKWHDGALILA